VQRILVDQAVASQLEDELRQRVEKIVLGDPRSAVTQLGPMISELEAKRAASWIDEAKETGARIAFGAERTGSLMTPTVLADVSDDARIMRDEIFAPVVALRTVSGLDEAISVANSTRYGLQAGIFTSNLNRAFRAAYRLDVGGVMINDTSSYHADLMPYGGTKDSGYGVEGPRYAVEDMTHSRIIVFNHVVPSW
jgi:acyl-CoA reductase-like NAD-dependent aldehyde dehydrogenase